MKSSMTLHAPAQAASLLAALLITALVAFTVVGYAVTTTAPAQAGSTLMDANLAP